MTEKKTYFVSDMHFGTDVFGKSAEREKRFVAWLDSIKNDAKTIYLLGDVFDFWFEYRQAAPRGYTRFLGKIAELCDAGVEICWFTGNHDIWIFDYLPQELGVKLFRHPIETEISGKKFFLAHGDGLGDESIPFRFVRAFFHNKVCQFLFRLIHPDFGIWLAKKWAKHSRMKEIKRPLPYQGEDKEHLLVFAKKYLQTHPDADFMIFGHRHIVYDVQFPPHCRVVNLGDWLQHFSYAVFDGKELTIHYFTTRPAP